MALAVTILEREACGRSLGLLASLLLFLRAASGAPQSIESDFIVHSWQTDAGLPHNVVTSIEQTSDGYIWVGTSNGLARFDGVRFTTHRTMDFPGLQDNTILCLFEDRSGVLWIGTASQGLSGFKDGQFFPVLPSQGLASETVLSIGEDSSGQLWVGTTTGTSHSEDRKFFRSEFLTGNTVFSIRQPQRSGVVFATRKGLYQLRFDRVQPYEPAPTETRTNTFLCLHQDTERRLWAGGPDGLLRVDSSAKVDLLPSSKIDSSSVAVLLEAGDGQIWFGTSAGGLFRTSTLDHSLQATLVAHFPHPVTSLLQGNEGNLWVGTAGGGLHRVKRRQLLLLPFPPVPQSGTPCVFEDVDGSVLLLSEQNELFRAKHKAFAPERRLALPEGVVVRTISAGTNLLWLGTENDGLFRITTNSVRQFSERDGLSDSGITGLCRSDRGVWIGTRNGGLNLLSPDGTVTRFGTPWGYMRAAATVLLEHNGDLWIGTSGDGLFRLNGRNFSAYETTGGLPSGTIQALHVERDGTLWIGTLGGLCRLRDGEIKRFPGPGSLEPEAVVQLSLDTDGNVWVGSSSGIYRYTRTQLDEYAVGKTRVLDVLPYGRDDGLPPLQCLPGLLHGSPRLAPFRILFATSRGLVASAGTSITLNTDPPPVVMEAVLLGNEPVNVAAMVTVPPGTPSVQFRYTALSYTAPGKVAFRYRLEGLDSDWSEVTTVRSARYPKIPPGKYSFHVVARNSDGIWNETGARLALVVAPFWWETAWFRFGVPVLGAAVIISLYRQRRKRLREIERLRIKIASDLHDDVGSSLWSINLLSRMLAQHGRLPEDEKHDVAEINRIAIQTSNSIRDIIWLINPAFDSMQDMLARVKDSAATTLRGISLRIESDAVDMTVRLPSGIRQNLFLLFKEALTNVGKHANATEVRFQITQTPLDWIFDLSDNGIGFDSSSAYDGNGLKNMRRRAKEIGGQLNVLASPGKGARIIVTVRKPRPNALWRLVSPGKKKEPGERLRA